LKDISVDSLLADGLHPNDEGYHLIFKLVLRELGIGKARKHFCG
jgi:lysophospholipase L1-like esterase